MYSLTQTDHALTSITEQLWHLRASLKCRKYSCTLPYMMEAMKKDAVPLVLLRDRGQKLQPTHRVDSSAEHVQQFIGRYLTFQAQRNEENMKETSISNLAEAEQISRGSATRWKMLA
jgi:hypothetical protein